VAKLISLRVLTTAEARAALGLHEDVQDVQDEEAYAPTLRGRLALVTSEGDTMADICRKLGVVADKRHVTRIGVELGQLGWRCCRRLEKGCRTRRYYSGKVD